jgi:hypothetical protein
MGNNPTKQQAPATKAPAAAPAAAALPAPANTFAAPTGRSTVTVVCQPGTTYGLAVQHNGATVVLPFALPAWASNGGPVPVVLASTNANWLGRNAAPLVAHLCYRPNPAGMGVYLQPHGAQGCKANAYTKGISAQVMA